jgi:hypothetical protein
MPTAQARPRFRRRVQRLIVAATLVAMVGLGVGIGLLKAVTWAPPFYRQALQRSSDPDVAAQAREELSDRLFEVYSRRWEGERFVTSLGQEALNAFLESEVATHLPAWRPPHVRQVRLAIEPDRLRVGMHYQWGPLTTVVWAEGELYLTPHDNELAVRLHRLRLGAIPLPPSMILQPLSHSGQQAGLIVQWSEVADDPVLLVRPATSPTAGDEPRIVLEQLTLQDGAVLLAGRWVRVPAASANLEPSTATRKRHDPPEPASQPTVPPDGSEEVSSVHPTLQTR